MKLLLSVTQLPSLTRELPQKVPTVSTLVLPYQVSSFSVLSPKSSATEIAEVTRTGAGVKLGMKDFP